MYISEFRYHRPETLQEACEILDASPSGAVLAGGTDLLVELKQGKRCHRDLVSLRRIPELRSIHLEGDRLCIGAAVTHSRLLNSALLREHCPAVVEAAQTIATEQIRNTATVGGNLCTAASCSDTAPVLIALEAEIELAGVHGSRRLPLQSFFVAHRKSVLKQGEILTRILVPATRAGTGASFRKFGLREAASIAVASVAARVQVQGERCSQACLVIGAVAPTPKLCSKACHLVEGRPATQVAGDRNLLARVGRAVADEAAPIDDIRGSAQYRRELLEVLTERALLAALERARQS